ncbi:MAG: molybdenum cofactor guanylyltransferase [Acidobacteriota bacterium]
MSRAGFVLVGGASSRMGRDKALLPFRGATLVEHVAAEVERAAGSVRLVGAPERYRHLPYAVVPDRRPGYGPLGGVETALLESQARWNLVVACDMPAVTAAFLGSLLEAAEGNGFQCLVPVAASGRPEPLCAVYERGCLAAVSALLDRGVRKMTDALAALQAGQWKVPEEAWFENLNTPEAWANHAKAPREGR